VTPEAALFFLSPPGEGGKQTWFNFNKQLLVRDPGVVAPPASSDDKTPMRVRCTT
jgi:hypothetical protein